MLELLTPQALSYEVLRRVPDLATVIETEAKVTIVSTGPRREETIIR